MAAKRRLGVLGALLLVALALPLTAAGRAHAAVFDPLTLVHSEQVAGDFQVVGNGVLVCPSAGADRASCLAASQRANNLNNNQFRMEYADVDSDPATFDSSSAQVTIPAGSRVTYARLSWGANRDGQQCGIGDAGSYPPGSSRTRRVRLTVGGAAPTDVAPQGWTSDTTSIGYYSADADVTAQLSGLAAGAPVTVTVGNVFAPQGVGCFGGWSLTVVHTDDAADCSVPRREVFVYDGHVRQGVTDPPLDVPVSGFRVSGAPARVGVTAYEGDNGQTGDQLLLNGTALTDPAPGGTTTNFFRSTAQGQVAPAYPNNFSVDAKTLTVPAGVVPVGSTSATLRITTTADAFLLQSLVLSVPVPSLCVEKSVAPAVVHAGDTVTWTVRVSNPSGADATGVVLDDPQAPGCDATLGTLAAGAATTVTCTGTVADDTTNIATASGTGAGGVPIRGSGTATVDVVHPALAVTKSASTASAAPGQPVTWTIEVRNTGDTVLDPVAVDDTPVDACDRTGLGPLAAGARASYSCAAPMPATDLANTARASGTDPLGRVVTADAAATVTALAAPGVELTKTGPDAVAAGEPVAWTLTVTNTGGLPLTAVTVTDPAAPDCARTFASLAPGAHERWRCTGHDATNTATVTAQSSAGAVSDEARARTQLVHPEVDVSATVVAGHVEVVVEDTGDTALSEGRVTVAGDPCADGLDLGRGDQRTTRCPLPATGPVTVVVTVQPTYAGAPVGPRLRATARAQRPSAPSTGPTPTGTLPDAGGSATLLPAGVAGAVLVLAGAALLLLVRRRS